MERLMVELPIAFLDENSLDLEELGIKPNPDNDDICNSVIDLYEIKEINPSTDENKTTIRMSYELAFNVNIPYEKFKDVYSRLTAINILKFEEII